MALSQAAAAVNVCAECQHASAHWTRGGFRWSSRLSPERWKPLPSPSRFYLSSSARARSPSCPFHAFRIISYTTTSGSDSSRDPALTATTLSFDIGRLAGLLNALRREQCDCMKLPQPRDSLGSGDTRYTPVRQLDSIDTVTFLTIYPTAHTATLVIDAITTAKQLA